MWLLLACRGAIVADPYDPPIIDTAADTEPAIELPEEPIVPLDGPPPVPDVAIAELIPGEQARLTVAPVRAGARVRIALSAAEGSTCVASGLCFGLAGPLVQIAELTAGDRGYAEAFVAVPSDAPAGRDVVIQAVVDDPTGAVLSTVFARRVGPAACGQTYKAACGWDGTTWSNRCAAAFAGWVTRYDGPC